MGERRGGCFTLKTFHEAEVTVEKRREILWLDEGGRLAVALSRVLGRGDQQGEPIYAGELPRGP